MASINLMGRKLVNISATKFLKTQNSFKKSFLSASYISDTFSSRRFYGKAYQADGTTIAFVVNKKDSNTVTVNSVRNSGIVLSSEAELVGASILFPFAVFSWNVTCAEDVNEESLTLFKVLEPKIDILIFGYGLPQDYTPKVRQNFTQICKKLGIKFEALPTEQAAGLFNFFSLEERFAVAALIPPKSIRPRFVIGKQQYDHLGYEDEDEESNNSLLKENYKKLLT